MLIVKLGFCWIGDIIIIDNFLLFVNCIKADIFELGYLPYCPFTDSVWFSL